MTYPTAQIVDLRNWLDLKSEILEKVAKTNFLGFDIDPDDAIEMINSKGIWTDRRIMDEIFTPTAAQEVRPLMPLKKGHLALLIASGFINNQI